MPQIVYYKRPKAVSRIALVACVAVVGIGAGLWVWIRPKPATTPVTEQRHTTRVYTAPITAADIQRAHDNVTVEGNVTAYSPQALTIKPLGATKQQTFKITSATAFTKTALYTAADGKDIRVGEDTQVLYSKASGEALKVAYGF
jgi:hypothetical protein